MFESTTSPLLLSYFGVPFKIGGRAPDGLVRVGVGERGLLWPEASPARPLRELRFREIPLYAGILDDDVAEVRLGRGWEPFEAIEGREGERVGSVWRDERGGVFLPFDPDEAIRSYWSEAYTGVGGGAALLGGAKQLALRAYYRARPVLPRSAQIAMRRAFSRLQARTRFPRWPFEPALHDLYTLLLGLLADVAGEPVPFLAPWPGGSTWALVLTHDVETHAGYEAIELLRAVEREHGYRSSWNFVPRRYDVDDAVVDALWRDGFEVGVHGLYHDGRDLESRSRLEERLPAIREWAERWRSVGFRSPATHRDWELMPLLGFDYDSSYPDTDPFEPQAGGCCSLLPFENDALVELPITLPQDHTIFVILGHPDESCWVEKTHAIRERQGMALLITHPDYMLERPLIAAYDRFLERFRDDETCWRALPKDVAAWWRRRAASRLEREGDGWRIDGPAAEEGRIAYERGSRQAAYL